jgi:hypothetical protein
VNKILFLDIDGVLHPSSEKNPSKYFSKVSYLTEGLSVNTCNIVISSSWRFHLSIDELKSRFPNSIKNLIVDVTGDPYIGEYSRYNEILSYLKSIDKPFMRWITLDDSLFEFPNKCENLIECNPNTGLEISEVKKLKEWLSS